MALRLGTSTPGKLYLGSTEITKAYLGASEVYSSLWTPAELTGLALWLDADDASSITLNGSTVSQWDDKSGNDRNVSQATAANQPTYLATGFNSLPTIDFDGSGDFLKNASYEPTSASLTCFIVYSLDVIGGTFILVQKTGGLFEINGGFGGSYTNITFTGAGPDNPSQGFDDANPTGTNRIIGIQYDGNGNAPSDFSARLDGVAQSIVNSAALGYQSETGFTIGHRPVQNISSFNGKISELIYTENQLSLLDQQKLEGYLAHKWGLTANLPADHPYKLTPPYADEPVYDPDAEAYFNRVEGPTGDNQTLEASVKTAINNFVVGCKADGIWDAIKSSAILAGARTLSGALQPLVGTAPTNFNFVSGDYDRKTGLKGNGSTKYLNSNRNNNADPQDDRHVACYRSRAQNSNQAYIAARTGGNVIGANYLWTTGAAPQFTCVPNTDTHTSNGSDTIGVATFHGVSRANSTTTTGRISGVNYSFSSTSATPISNNLRIFCGANDSIPEFFTNARLSFYSIGESLDLAALDARVSALMTAIDGAIP